ncbi:MAG TPA: helix-turn-helix transcriptional regulator [Micavibrio sp.]|jgi:transcriptional regulator with XRE-family HTH domain
MEKTAGKKGRSGDNDRRIGENMRFLRVQAGLSQKDAARHLNITYQQVQKYENGRSRISATSLHALGSLYMVPYLSFFEGLERTDCAYMTFPDTETMRLIALLANVTEPALKTKICKVIRILAS